jgi:hypothetical protein
MAGDGLLNLDLFNARAVEYLNHVEMGFKMLEALLYLGCVPSFCIQS